MKRASAAMALTMFTGCLFAQDQPTANAGKQEEQQSCIPCHSLRLVDSQRLSQAAWEKELTKMIGWGAVVPDRKILVDYLTQEYGQNKPPLPGQLTANGTKQESAKPSSK